MSKSWTEQSRNSPPELARNSTGGGVMSQVTARSEWIQPSSPAW